MERLNHRLSFFFSPWICFLLSCAKVALFILKKGYCFFGSCEWDEISAPPSLLCLCYLYICIVNQWKIRKKWMGFQWCSWKILLIEILFLSWFFIAWYFGWKQLKETTITRHEWTCLEAQMGIIVILLWSNQQGISVLFIVCFLVYI
jgi:hypothetical protein